MRENNELIFQLKTNKDCWESISRLCNITKIHFIQLKHQFNFDMFSVFIKIRVP